MSRPLVSPTIAQSHGDGAAATVPLVRMRGITKRFGALVADDRVDLDLFPGEIHALLGENGAGKSTLMHVLSGSLRPDEGEIELAGAPTHFTSTREALGAGIGMVHQHFRLVSTLSVAANVLLNDEPVSRGLLDDQAARTRVAELAASLGLEVNPDVVVGTTSIATQQKVEILKVLHRHVRVLIMDEPTAVLSPQEVRDLFVFLRTLARAGSAVVLITHKLAEVLGAADRLSILRGGKLVFTGTTEGQTLSSLATLMVGREVPAPVQAPRSASQPGQAVLQLENVRAVNDRGSDILSGINLECREGEMLGIAGVDGNGQDELVEVLCGLRPIADGVVRWFGQTITIGSVVDQIRRGVAYIPEDRQRRALVLDLPLEQNLVLRTYRDRAFARRLHLRHRAIAAHAARLLRNYGIRGAPQTPARSLSGGNQQKLVVARELSGAPRLLVAAQPTRGVDVGATQFIYDELRAQRDKGVAILLVSFDLDELMALSDRISVMYRGRIVVTLPRAEATPETLGLYMTGAREREGQ